MTCKTYQILNQKLNIWNANASIIPEAFETFQGNEDEAELVFTCENESENGNCYGIQYLAGAGRTIHNVFFSKRDKSQIMYTFEKEYSKFLLQTDECCTEEVISELLMAGFYSYMALRDTLLMHASAVSCGGKAVVFTAPSGTGKTTQAELWAKYKGAQILNGDKVFLKRDADAIHAWGSPWKGSSAYAENAGAPLRAIVVLQQAEENSIQKLEGFDVLESVIPHVFFPSWDQNCEQAVLTCLDQVLGETEVYLLKCRPDEAAVELLASALKES